MDSQISFTADRELKDKAMQKARDRGITLKSLLIFSMKAFVEDKIEVGVIAAPGNEVEELQFDSRSIHKNAEKLARLLK